MLRAGEEILWVGRPQVGSVAYSRRVLGSQRYLVVRDLLDGPLGWRHYLTPFLFLLLPAVVLEPFVPGLLAGLAPLFLFVFLLWSPGYAVALLVSRVVSRSEAARRGRLVYAITTERLLMLGLGVADGPPVWKNLEYLFQLSVERDGSAGTIILGPDPDPRPRSSRIHHGGAFLYWLWDKFCDPNGNIRTGPPRSMEIGAEVEAVWTLLLDARAKRLAALQASGPRGFRDEYMGWHGMPTS